MVWLYSDLIVAPRTREPSRAQNLSNRRCSDHDPPPPPPPLSANVVRHPVQQTLRNFGRIRKLSPICCTTLLGSKNQEMTHPAPGFLISWVLGGSNEQNTGNKKSSPWMSYFPGCGLEQNPGNRNPAPGFLISRVLGGSKTQEIRNPAPGFLISCVLGRPKTNKIRNPAPGFLISCVFGPASGGKKTRK